MTHLIPEQKCYLILMQSYKGVLRHEDCACMEHWFIPEGRRVIRCTECGREYDPRIGTAFDRTNTDLGVWFYAIDRWNDDLLYNAHQLSKEIGITYVTARRIMRVVKSYVWHREGYYPLGRAEVAVKRTRVLRPLGAEDFVRKARTYKRREMEES